MNRSKFDERYRQLNARQKEAVDWIEGPVMVIAGPGTGKTELLTLRIANILLKTQISPENVLALTFTESGVASMRSRLFEIVGSPAYRVPIHTFHGFCNEIIRRFPEFFPRVVGSQNITEVEQVQMIERLLADTEGVAMLRPAGNRNHYAGAILKGIGTLKREGISVETFEALLAKEERDFGNIPDLYHEKGAHAGKMRSAYKKQETVIKKNRELLLLYRAYEETLATEHLYDYDDMIMEVSRSAEDSDDLLLMLQEAYQYVLVDEHQDTNRAQNTVLALIMGFHESPNLFVVGDMKQAIFRFQGASEANFRFFREQYPDAKEIVMQENYRSTQTILDAALGIITDGSPASVGKPDFRLKAKAGHAEKPISVFECASPDIEEFFIAEDIQKKLLSGILPEAIAVLFRDNRDSKGIARALAKAGIPYSIGGNDDAFSDPEMRKLMIFFRAISDFGSEELFAEALHADFLRIPPLAVYELLAFARRNRTTVFRALTDDSFLSSLDATGREALARTFALFERLARSAKNDSFFDFFDFAIRESGFLAHLVSRDDSLFKMESLVGLFDATREYAARRDTFTVKDFLGFVDALEAHQIRVRRGTSRVSRNAVNLMTAHKSKGTEFDHVYITGAVDGHWGGRTVREMLPLIDRVYSLFSLPAHEGKTAERDENDEPSRLERQDEADERRLFFVALTRGRKHVTVTFSKHTADGTPLLPSRFVNELSPACVERKSAEDFERKLEKNKSAFFAPARAKECDIKTATFVSSLFDEYGLSVTGLNNYFECPWKYFYMNLLRVPKEKEPHLLFGTAVHEALKDFVDALRTRDVGEEFIIEAFRRRLSRQEFPKRDFEEYFTRGSNALAGYVRANAPRLRVPAKNEFEIGKVMMGDIPLTGKIDRMEFLDPPSPSFGKAGDSRRVLVVDYKTGKPKSRNAILGETKASEARLDSRRADARRGNIFRQLLFYKLLLSHYDAPPSSRSKRDFGGASGAYKVEAGEIDFIEPTEGGSWKKERFDLPDEEVVKLAEDIRRVAGEIRTLAFWDSFCEDGACKFCAVRKMMNPVREAGLGSRLNI